MPDGGYLIADAGNDRVRRVSPDGTITTVAGTGTFGFSGDGGPATAANLSPARGGGVPDGGYLIADAGAARIRRVSPTGIDHDRRRQRHGGVLRRRRRGDRGAALTPRPEWRRCPTAAT